MQSLTLHVPLLHVMHCMRNVKWVKAEQQRCLGAATRAWEGHTPTSLVDCAAVVSLPDTLSTKQALCMPWLHLDECVLQC